jgi:ribosomal protein L37AE/L43A
MEEEKRRCITCGTHEWEWDRYEAGLWQCEKCADLEWKKDDIVEADSKGWRPALFGVDR